MVGLLTALFGCATVERPRPVEVPFADPSLAVSPAHVAALAAVPRELGFARRDEASLCKAVDAAIAGRVALDAVFAAHPAPADRPALRALVTRARGLTAAIPADDAPPGPASARVDWPALAEAAGDRSGAVVTWGAWSGPPPWGPGACVRPERVEPWVRRLHSAQEITCLAAPLRATAAAQWDALTSAGCWCTAEPAAVLRLAQVARGVTGFEAGANRIEVSLAVPSAQPARLDPEACP